MHATPGTGRSPGKGEWTLPPSRKKFDNVIDREVDRFNKLTMHCSLITQVKPEECPYKQEVIDMFNNDGMKLEGLVARTIHRKQLQKRLNDPLIKGMPQFRQEKFLNSGMDVQEEVAGQVSLLASKADVHQMLTTREMEMAGRDVAEADIQMWVTDRLRGDDVDGNAEFDKRLQELSTDEAEARIGRGVIDGATEDLYGANKTVEDSGNRVIGFAKKAVGKLADKNVRVKKIYYSSESQTNLSFGGAGAAGSKEDVKKRHSTDDGDVRGAMFQQQLRHTELVESKDKYIASLMGQLDMTRQKHEQQLLLLLTEIKLRDKMVKKAQEELKIWSTGIGFTEDWGKDLDEDAGMDMEDMLNTLKKEVASRSAEGQHEIAQYKREIQALRQQLLEQEKHYKARMEEADAPNQQLIQELKMEVGTRDRDLANKDITIANLEADIDNLRSEMADVVFNSGNLEARVMELTEENERLEGELLTAISPEELDARMELEHAKLEELQKEHDAAVALLQVEHEAEIAKCEEEIAAERMAYKELSDSLAQMREQLSLQEQAAKAARLSDLNDFYESTLGMVSTVQEGCRAHTTSENRFLTILKETHRYLDAIPTEVLEQFESLRMLVVELLGAVYIPSTNMLVEGLDKELANILERGPDRKFVHAKVATSWEVVQRFMDQYDSGGGGANVGIDSAQACTSDDGADSIDSETTATRSARSVKSAPPANTTPMLAKRVKSGSNMKSPTAQRVEWAVGLRGRSRSSSLLRSLREQVSGASPGSEGIFTPPPQTPLSSGSMDRDRSGSTASNTRRSPGVKRISLAKSSARRLRHMRLPSTRRQSGVVVRDEGPPVTPEELREALINLNSWILTSAGIEFSSLDMLNSSWEATLGGVRIIKKALAKEAEATRISSSGAYHKLLPPVDMPDFRNLAPLHTFTLSCEDHLSCTDQEVGEKRYQGEAFDALEAERRQQRKAYYKYLWDKLRWSVMHYANRERNAAYAERLEEMKVAYLDRSITRTEEETLATKKKIEHGLDAVMLGRYMHIARAQALWTEERRVWSDRSDALVKLMALRHNHDLRYILVEVPKMQAEQRGAMEQMERDIENRLAAEREQLVADVRQECAEEEAERQRLRDEQRERDRLAALVHASMQTDKVEEPPPQPPPPPPRAATPPPIQTAAAACQTQFIIIDSPLYPDYVYGKMVPALVDRGTDVEITKDDAQGIVTLSTGVQVELYNETMRTAASADTSDFTPVRRGDPDHRNVYTQTGVKGYVHDDLWAGGGQHAGAACGHPVEPVAATPTDAPATPPPRVTSASSIRSVDRKISFALGPATPQSKTKPDSEKLLQKAMLLQRRGSSPNTPRQRRQSAAALEPVTPPIATPLDTPQATPIARDEDVTDRSGGVWQLPASGPRARSAEKASRPPSGARQATPPKGRPGESAFRDVQLPEDPWDAASGRATQDGAEAEAEAVAQLLQSPPAELGAPWGRHPPTGKCPRCKTVVGLPRRATQMICPPPKQPVRELSAMQQLSKRHPKLKLDPSLVEVRDAAGFAVGSEVHVVLDEPAVTVRGVVSARSTADNTLQISVGNAGKLGAPDAVVWEGGDHARLVMPLVDPLLAGTKAPDGERFVKDFQRYSDEAGVFADVAGTYYQANEEKLGQPKRRVGVTQVLPKISIPSKFAAPASVGSRPATAGGTAVPTVHEACVLEHDATLVSPTSRRAPPAAPTLRDIFHDTRTADHVEAMHSSVGRTLATPLASASERIVRPPAGHDPDPHGHTGTPQKVYILPHPDVRGGSGGSAPRDLSPPTPHRLTFTPRAGGAGLDVTSTRDIFGTFSRRAVAYYTASLCIAAIAMSEGDGGVSPHRGHAHATVKLLRDPRPGGMRPGNATKALDVQGFKSSVAAHTRGRRDLERVRSAASTRSAGSVRPFSGGASRRPPRSGSPGVVPDTPDLLFSSLP